MLQTIPFSVLVVEHDKCVLFSPEPIVVKCTTKTDTDPHRLNSKMTVCSEFGRLCPLFPRQLFSSFKILL